MVVPQVGTTNAQDNPVRERKVTMAEDTNEHLGSSDCSSSCDMCHGYKTFSAFNLPVNCPKCSADNRGKKKQGCQNCNGTGRAWKICEFTNDPIMADCEGCDGGRLFN